MDKALPDLEKNGDKPSGDSQPVNNDSQVDSLEGELDKVLTDTEEFDTSKFEPDDEGHIVLSKEEFGKLQNNLKNYKQGLTSLKPKLKELKKSKPQEVVQKKEEKPDDKEFLSKKDFYKSNEREAIEEACKNPAVEKHWDKIILSYSGKRGKATVKDIVEDINDSISIFKDRNPDLVKDFEEMNSPNDLGVDRSKPTGDSSKGKGGKEQQPKKRVLPEKTAVGNWYPKPEKK